MRTLGWLLTISLLAPACSDDRAEPPPSTSDTVPIDQIESLQVEALCDLLFRCPAASQDTAVARLVYGDAGRCQQALAGALDLGDLKRAVAEGKVRYDGAAAKRCIAELRADCGALEFSERRQPTSCQATFVGTVAAGGACQRDEECSGEAYCGTSTSTAARCPGVCRESGAIGAECRSTVECKGSGVTGTPRCLLDQNSTSGQAYCRDVRLAAPAAENSACGLDPVANVDTPCGAGLWCDPSLGRCLAAVPLGVACDPGASVCVDNAACVPADGGGSGSVCRVVQVQRAAGQSCDGTQICGPLEGLDCVAGTCARVLPTAGPEGAACSRQDYAAPCDSGLYCSTAGNAPTCQRRRPLGEGCDAPDACSDGSCVDGRCVARDCLVY